MPPAALAAMAKKAGKSIKTAEKYWKQAKESAEKRGRKAKDYWAYVMGIVKRRLGLADHDLALVGLPTELVLEATVLDLDVEVEEGLTPFDRVWQTLALVELWRVDKFKLSSPLIGRSEDGVLTVKEDFFEQLVEQAGGDSYRQWLKLMFPHVLELYFEFMVHQGAK